MYVHVIIIVTLMQLNIIIIIIITVSWMHSKSGKAYVLTIGNVV